MAKFHQWKQLKQTVNPNAFCVHIYFFITPIDRPNYFQIKKKFFLTDATKVSGKMMMWVQWTNKKTQYVAGKVANKMWPAMVIRYYESHIHLNDEQ